MTTPNGQASSPFARIVNWALGLSLVGLAIATGLQKIRSFDYWWHLKTGQLISATGTVPILDPFSFSAEGSRWIDIHWLFQLGLHKLYGFGGHTAVMWAKILLVLLLVAILGGVGYRRGRSVVTGAALAFMLVIACDRFMVRPELLSFAFLAALLALFHRFERSPDRTIYAVVAIQLFWVNVHGLFAVGIAVCGIYLVAEIVDTRILGKRPLEVMRIRRLAIVTLLATLVSIANPNGLDAAVYPLQQLTMIGTAEQRTASPQTLELMAIGVYWFKMSGLLKTILSCVVFFSFAAMVANRRRLRTSDVLLWLAFAVLALSAQRNLALFAIVMTPIAVRNWNEFLDTRPAWPRLKSAATLILAVAIAGSVVDISRDRFFRRLGWLRESGFGLMEIMQPAAATQWIAEYHPPGPIFHSGSDGGYLIWYLYPEYQVLSDGRLEVFGVQRRAELGVRRARGFRMLDEKYHFQTALLNFGQVDYSELIQYLYQKPEWRLVFVDDIAAVFTRADRSVIDVEVDVENLQFRRSMKLERGANDAYRKRARLRFVNAIKRGRRVKEDPNRAIRNLPEYQD